ncbi:MAG TPA: TetR/AcrR family transcriptional regulator [Stackebrandtia sp.]|jgi:AcrR family transcriptional regulator|uniref:TetR/AcrR family transcriptional regulator n=1 Tax=Stackebrandtia sp. TaxID=2023065 RepID=UPI002D654475|nr:TetR/AcrR family transcriptional regulator [Stackebrandtia sp.]HZE38303.1 TetR/AcrR family transcriptional regulator [Stackebrandtia sp.]
MGNREKLLAAAKKCLFDKGYERTTVRDLASEAKVSMAAIGYHFGSKEALLNQAMFEALDEGALGSDTSELPADPDADPSEVYAGLWQALVESFAAHETFWVASLEAAVRAQRDPALAEQMADGLRQGHSGMARVLTGIPEDEIPDSVVRSVGAVQTALMGGVAMQRLIDPDNALTADEILEGLRALGKLANKGD